jgi:hypothetical protein
MKSWEIIADNLSKNGFGWGCVSAIDSNGRTIWIADAHRDDGKRYVVRADEKLTGTWKWGLVDENGKRRLLLALARSGRCPLEPPGRYTQRLYGQGLL